MEGTQIVKPAAGQASITEQTQEESEKRAAAARLERSKITNTNKVARMLTGVTYMIENHSFPFLVFKGNPLMVSEYYPELRIAVDKFMEYSDSDKMVVAFKRQQFKKNKIKYGHLTPERSLADLHEELGL